MSFTVPFGQPGLQHNPTWYRRAIFYEVMVRAFADSDGDGVGDFEGLISKLDYLEWLGVDALWLPPFYASPLLDGGYDIADYRQVLPEYGTVDDFRELVTQAHQRNMRVIIDLVLNHTSDQHPWFHASRTDPHGPYGDYYVWSDTDDLWPDIRIIFSDTETSNWAFDSERRQFYFHRFFSHQPDLNYGNPAVQQEMFEVVRYWLDMGVDGFRLDAVPYLFVSEEGNGESEPETHEFIRVLRELIDREYPGRVLISEANQAPLETAKYFGNNDAPECHMAFDFPVMPRIFYALRSQTVANLAEVLQETADVPAQGAWGLFLRNHDELSLEMVTDDERQAMYGWYAYDPRMRINEGIRRRLAPLLGNSRHELELVHALLLSLPGTPFLYYGDEIGMGDNIWLNDRDASRTPMQWTPDRNAGFSTADPGKLFLPAVQSLGYHYNAVNVESQLAQSRSLLHFVRNIVHTRRAHPVFGEGFFELLRTDNLSVLAFVRRLDEADCQPGETPETVLCVFSVAHHPVSATVELPESMRQAKINDLFSGARFPSADAKGALTLTLPSHGFYWLSVK